MLVPLLFALSCVVVSGADAQTKERKFGKHLFPEWTPSGHQSANEFQHVLSENIRHIRDVRGYQSSGDSVFDSISPMLINNNDVVTVSYKSSDPKTNDWIAAYSPADIDITTTVPVKYGWCDDDDNFMTNGFGSLTFNMTNLRSDIKFYYFTNGTSHPIILDESSELVKFNDINEPLRPRVVPGRNPDEFKLLWSSATSESPTLVWGTAPGEYQTTVLASTSTVTKDSLCGGVANTTGWRETGLIHTAVMAGMKALANQKVYYIFGDENTKQYSKEFTFFVPPLAGTQPPTRPTTVILYDDMGRGSEDMTYTWNEYGRPAVYTIQSVGAEVMKGDIDAVYHGGDISYATGYLAVWDFFFNMLSPVASSVLYLSTVGNHESDWYNSASAFSNGDSGGECGVPATQMLPMPPPATTNEPWWSYDVGLIHFIGMSTEHDYVIGSKQYRWLERDLKMIDRSVTPWIIFGGHRPMYINSDYGGSESSDINVMDKMILNIEPLLYKYRVNLAFYGHNHVMQRQSAVKDKQVVQKAVEMVDEEGNTYWNHEDPQATVHMVIGAAGGSFTKNAMTGDAAPVWSELVIYEYGYARVTAVNASYLDWKFIQNTGTGKVLDHMVIKQSDPSQPFTR
jgi:hypothetical protein